jgi:hypothetical protein
MRRLVITIAVVLAGAATLVATGLGAPGSKPFKVASTLDGKKVLPHRIHWLGLPTLGPGRVREVDFLIDGKVHWIEHNPPYVYGDNDGQHRGYLVTSWLSPGKHRFTVRVVASNGRTASDTVVARVPPAPNPPAALAGTWERTIDATNAPKPGSAGNPTSSIVASGPWKLTFEKRWVRDSAHGKFVFPQSNSTGLGLYYLDDYTATSSQIHLVGEVIFHPVRDNLPEGGWWCWMDGPPSTYTWTVSGNTLTLAPVGGHDACGIRGFVWAGQWTRS